MSIRSLRPMLMAAIVLLAAACSSFGTKLEAPHIELVAVQMLSTDMFAQRFKVRVRVQNPNDIDLKVTGLDYKILLMGDSFADGVSTDRFIVPPLGEAEFDMTVTTNFVSAFGRLLSRVGGGRLENIDYEIAGKVDVVKGPIRKIPFSHRGSVDFTRALGPPKSGDAKR
jgi:LEA14-like dessication related protein